MMADLFAINRTAMNEALKSLAKNRIESFINIEIQYTIGKCKCNTIFKSFNGVISFNFE